MDDNDILLYLNSMNGPQPIGEIIGFMREQEGKTQIEFLALFDHDFSGRMRDLVNKGLLTCKYTSGANLYSLTPKGKAEVNAVLG